MKLRWQKPPIAPGMIGSNFYANFVLHCKTKYKKAFFKGEDMENEITCYEDRV
jgi:hypothetical protein